MLRHMLHNYVKDILIVIHDLTTPVLIAMFAALPGGLVVRIRRSHRRGPGSIPGQGNDHF